MILMNLFNHQQRILSFGFLIALLLATWITPALAQEREIKLRDGEVYTNLLSHFQFPPAIGTFERESFCTQYDAKGLDTSVGYNDTSNVIALTFYVYPVMSKPPNDNLEGHYAGCQSAVLRAHPEAVTISQGKIELTPGGQKQDGMYAKFKFTDVFAHKNQPVRSELYLFMYQHNFILYRITYPVGRQAAAESAIKNFIDSLAWPQ
jgi:hypothetical protein